MRHKEQRNLSYKKQTEMKYGNRDIDHIVYSVLDLDAAIDQIEKSLGARPVIGGRHLNKGTKNALLNLGNRCYLEILAIDEDNKEINGPRWMGIDLIEEACITRWALKSSNILEDQKLLHSYKTELGEIFQGERLTDSGATLRWQMSLPQASPRIELAPFVVDWTNSEEHPTENLVNDCTLENIQFKAPERNQGIRRCFSNFFNNYSIEGSAEEKINITIRGPKGILNL